MSRLICISAGFQRERERESERERETELLDILHRRVAEIKIFEKTYLIVIKDETGLKFTINDSN